MKKSYRWKRGSFGQVVPEIAAGEINRIVGDYGYVTPAIIVKEATKKRNPLHDCFEWDDTVAARMYRETQARYILRSIEVIVGEDEDESIHIRAFHSVVEDDEQIYTTLAHARETPELWEQVVEKALLEIKNWRETYKHIKAFEAIFTAIDEIA